jgi:hypothetical protein
VSRQFSLAERIFVYDATITDSAAFCIVSLLEDDEAYILMNADIQDAGACWLYAFPLLDALVPVAINLTPSQNPEGYGSRLMVRSVMRIADAPTEFRKCVDDMDKAAQMYLWEKLQQGPILVPYANRQNCISNRLFKSLQVLEKEQRKKKVSMSLTLDIPLVYHHRVFGCRSSPVPPEAERTGSNRTCLSH